MSESPVTKVRFSQTVIDLLAQAQTAEEVMAVMIESVEAAGFVHLPGTDEWVSPELLP